MGFGRRHLVLIISHHMLMVICHIETESKRKKRRERKREKRRERERIGCAIDIYTTYTVHSLLYLHVVELSV